jgi:Chaperone of endosialidase
LNNTIGINNTASGMNALFNNTTGSQNTASGFNALPNSTTGNGNIAVGFQAGLNLTTGSHNIDIGNKGVAAESGTVRIGTKSTQTATYIAGIYNNALSGLPVVVTSTGQLGVEATSSERFKTAIAPMSSNSAKLQQLRPVTFHYKANPHGALQYGLIAEEVAKVYPELVIRNESGRIDGVRYDELAPMLLNEVQQQAAEIRDLKQRQLRMQQQVAELRDLKQELHAALTKLQSKNELVAQR